MAPTLLSSLNSNLISASTKENHGYSTSFLGSRRRISNQKAKEFRNESDLWNREAKIPKGLSIFAATEGSAKSSNSEETVPSWAKPDAAEPPPWAREEGKETSAERGFEFPSYGYLLASSVTAIAAIGSIFEYSNQKPVFGILQSDSIFYVPLLGFFAFTGLPTSAFLWFKSVETANKEADEQDKRDGYL